MEWAAGSPHPAHPRAGGENWVQRDDAFTPAGSSPRGRGKLVDLGSELSDLGLIPARAGKTSIVWSTMRRRTAHPRAGGENARITHREHDGGLIPARAGKTRPTASSPPASTAHPRAGGEN